MINHNEKGYTLLETILSIAIVGIIIPVMAMTVSMLLTRPQKSVELNLVLREVENSGYWIIRDVQSAKTVSLGNPSGFPITFDISVDMDQNHDLTVVYSIDGSTLKRQVYDSLNNLTSEIIIAQFIDISNTNFSLSENGTYQLVAKASKGEAIAERSYQSSQRITNS